jgi:membrane protein DedA with SNARE-associated domain
LIAVSRFIPGGQTAISVTAGSLGFPRRRYAVFAGLGAVVWGVYGTLVGALGGDALRSGQLTGVLAAVGMVLVVGVVAEVTRRRQGRAGEAPEGL